MIRTAYLSVQVCNVAAVPSCFVPVMDLFTQHDCLSCRVSVYMQRTGKHVCYWGFKTPSCLWRLSTGRTTENWMGQDVEWCGSDLLRNIITTCAGENKESHKSQFLYSTFRSLHTAVSSTPLTHGVFLSFALHRILVLLSFNFTQRFPKNCSAYAKLQIQPTLFPLYQHPNFKQNV